MKIFNKFKYHTKTKTNPLPTNPLSLEKKLGILSPLLFFSLLFFLSSCGTADVGIPSTEVTVTDDCPANIVMMTAVAETTVAVSWTEPTAQDSNNNLISVSDITITDADGNAVAPDDDFPLGETIVTYTFTDGAGNTDDTCTFTVTVSQPPSTAVTVSACPDNITQTPIVATWTEPTAVDSNDNPVMIALRSHAPSSPFRVGSTTTIEYTFMDTEKNIGKCDFTITIDALPDGDYRFDRAFATEDPSVTNPFLIQTSVDLTKLATLVNAATTYTPVGGTASNYRASAYRLEESLNLAPVTGYNHIPIGIAPKGGASNYFTGTFDGNEKTLMTLSYDGAQASLGLFSAISNASISNLTLAEPSITNTATDGLDSTGSLVGTSLGTTSLISNVHVIGGSIDGASNVGGLVGYIFDGTIIASSVIGAVSGRYSTGGLVGLLVYATIEASTAAVTVLGEKSTGGLVGFNAGTITASTATGMVSGTRDVGGLVGTDEEGTITASTATGMVSGTSRVGGLVGSQDYSTITNSYATGAVNGRFNVGGLVGNRTTSAITASYATGAVNGLRVGGLVGIQTTSPTPVNSYWDTETTGQMSSAGGTGYTTAELQVAKTTTNLYKDWDDMVWTFMDGAYPTLSPLSP